MREGYTRVTQIISAFSGVEKVPTYILEPAADKGNRVHMAIESIIRGFGGVSHEFDIIPYLESYRLFWEPSKEEFKDAKIEIEKRLYCDTLKITGKIDLIVRFRNKTLAFDWKTSSKPRKSWDLQSSAYRYLLEVNDYPNVVTPLFVHLSKDGEKPAMIQDEFYHESLEMFVNCLDVFRYFDMDKARKTNESERFGFDKPQT